MHAQTRLWHIFMCSFRKGCLHNFFCHNFSCVKMHICTKHGRQYSMYLQFFSCNSVSALNLGMGNGSSILLSCYLYYIAVSLTLIFITKRLEPLKVAGRDAEDLGFLTLYLDSIKQSMQSKYTNDFLYTLTNFEQMDSGYEKKGPQHQSFIILYCCKTYSH